MINTETHTYKEILQQPDLWGEVVDSLKDRKLEIQLFLDKIKDDGSPDVIFTGAGSSFFIGEIVAPFFQKDTNWTSRAIETTEIVTHPTLHVNPHKNTLLVSFARSGNSPESVAAVNIANSISDKVWHLIITCNKNGALSSIKGERVFSFVLPDRANDKSLAMTSSVTSMALTALLIGRLDNLNDMQLKVQDASSLFENNIQKIEDSFEPITTWDYSRGIFLGSGPMKGVAHESHLKLQELTDGEIICKFDSFLGFRHGPKAVVDDKTMLVYFFSNDNYARQYEIDLVRGVSQQQSPRLTIGISNKPIEELNLDVSLVLDDILLDDAIWTITSLLPAQLLAFYKSQYLDYNPDSPSKSGAIHRVVQGVNIYKFKHNNKLNSNSNGQKS